MTTNERQNAYETNKNLMANQWKRNTIKTNTRKTNKVTKQRAMKRAIALKRNNDAKKITKMAKQYN